MPHEVTNKVILDEIRRSRQEIKASLEAVEAKILIKIEEQKQRITTIEEKYIELADKVERIQRKEKENNVVIFGLQKKPGDIDIEYITSEIKTLLNIDIYDSDLKNFYTLGKKENCPVKLEFVSHLKKVSILKNATRLKGTSISIVNDMTIKQREENKTLRKHLLIAKKKRENICYIKNNKLHINKEIYTAEELGRFDDTDDPFELGNPPETPAYHFEENVRTLRQPSLEDIATDQTTNNLEYQFKENNKVREVNKKLGKEIIREDKIATRSKK